MTADLRKPIPASPKRSATRSSKDFQTNSTIARSSTDFYSSASQGRYAFFSVNPRKQPDSKKLAASFHDMWQSTEQRRCSLSACLEMYNLYSQTPRIITNQVCRVIFTNRAEPVETKKGEVRSPCLPSLVPPPYNSALMEVLSWRMSDLGACVLNALLSRNFQTVFSLPLSMK